MSAYYPDARDRRYPISFAPAHHVFPVASPAIDTTLTNIDPNTVTPNPSHALGNGMDEVAADADAESAPSDPSRRCSVRGCQAVLPHGYSLKMCESCRGRHRIYATTKRQKRKMEKAALGAQVAAQGLAWMPQDQDEEQPRHGQCILEVGTRQKTRPVEVAHATPVAPVHPPIQPSHTPPTHVPNTYPYSASAWEQSALDPRLFSHAMQPASPPLNLPPPHTGHSELANALTLPPPSSSVSPGVASSRRTPSPVPMLVPVHNEPLPEGAREEDALPPRYCSIKGCKALVSGSSFFKMCQPCRDRYRSYGTTKRAKWRREKDKAVAAMMKSGSESGDGLVAQATGQTVPSAEGDPMNPQLPPRMCTVSHCRAVLPGTYPYLRCERHRVQNRHHSRLKRVRDKESKAQAWDEWSAALATNGTGATHASHEQSLQDQHIYTMEMEEELELDQSSGVIEASPAGAPQAGVPPAARGTRRTNHVCSIRTCCNLLSPHTPWKMCDECRARDRATRKDKASRKTGKEEADKDAQGDVDGEDGGLSQPAQDEQNTSTTAQDAASVQDIVMPIPPPAAPVETSPVTGEASASSSTNLIFMDPILPEASRSASASGSAEQPPEVPPAASGKRRTSRRKDKTAKSTSESEKRSGGEPGPSTSAASSSTSHSAGASSSATGTADAPQQYGTHIPPPYPIPYYVHPSFMPAYPGTNPTQYTYAPPYPPRPYVPGMYQPSPFPPYAQPYAYPAQPYPAPYPAQTYATPAAAATSQSPPTPPSLPVYTASFVARPDHGDTSFGPPESAPTTHYATFSARTGEDCTAPPRAPRRRALGGSNKRPREDEAESPPMASLMLPPIANSDGARSYESNTSAAEGEHSGNGMSGTQESTIVTLTCSNPNCHRTLPSGTVGSLCARCRERMRKKQMKAKQRFRLEPRALLGRSSVHHSTEGTPHSD